MRHKPVHTHTPRRPDSHSWHTPESRRRTDPAKHCLPLLWHNSRAQRPAAGASPGPRTRAMRAGRIIDTFVISRYIYPCVVPSTLYSPLKPWPTWLRFDYTRTTWLTWRLKFKIFTAPSVRRVNHIYSLSSGQSPLRESRRIRERAGEVGAHHKYC